MPRWESEREKFTVPVSALVTEQFYRELRAETSKRKTNTSALIRDLLAEWLYGDKKPVQWTPDEMETR